MPTANQPTRGLTAAILALMGGFAWLASHHRACRRRQAAIRAKLAVLDERTAACYMDAYVAGAEKRLTP